jgi:hypothetical protein
MAKWKRAAGLAAAGLMAAAASLLTGHQPAGATETAAFSQGSLTFVNNAGGTETCTIYLNVSRKTDPPSATAESGEDGSPPDCFGDVYLTLTLSYKDQYGHAQSVENGSFHTSTLTAQGAASKVSSTLTASYSDCDPSQNETCSLTISAAPK